MEKPGPFKNDHITLAPQMFLTDGAEKEPNASEFCRSDVVIALNKIMQPHT